MEEKFYALKILKKRDFHEPQAIERVAQEMELLKIMRHPFIIDIKANFQDSRRLYILFEFMQGGELYFHLRRHQAFTEDYIRCVSRSM